MKKLVIYILLFTIFFGAFAPLSSVHAQEVTGTCVRLGTIISSPLDPTLVGQNRTISVNGMLQSACVGGTITLMNPQRTEQQVVVSFTETGTSSTNPALGAGPETSDVSTNGTCGFSLSKIVTGFNFIACILEVVENVIYNIVLAPFATLAGLAGTGLDAVIQYTIVGMAGHVSGPNGFTGINIAWKLIRDLMNIFFIFILVYESILLILGLSSTDKIGKMIGYIVLAALLVNFSLFFTKIMIDASNVITIGIYNNIISTVGSYTIGDGSNGLTLGGIAVPFMSNLGLGQIFSTGSVATFGGGWNAIIAMFMGATFLFITAIIFIVVAVMFIIRYVTLLLLLMLSPIGFMGSALSFMKKPASDWWSALNSQLIFPPVYMLLTWVVLTLMQSDGFIRTSNAWAGQGLWQEKVNFVMNFIIIIVAMIATLIISKDISTKGSKFIGQATGKGVDMAFSGISYTGRRTMGAISGKIADNETLQGAAKTSNWARAGLYGARIAKEGTYDLRNASVPTSMVGDLLRSTAGQTDAGKKIGLDRVYTPNSTLGVSNVLAEAGGGKAGTLNYGQTVEAKNKMIREKDAKLAEEEKKAEAKRNAKAGKDAAEGTTAYIAMEKTITGSSEKQTEALLASNRELLQSQNFANMLSVRQLEAVMKSDQFTDEEKGRLKNARFSSISDIDKVNDSAYIAAQAKPEATRTQAEKDLIEKVQKARTKIKGLSDSEIEMLDTDKLFTDENFVSELKSSQVESINKSNKFTGSQKKSLKDTRLAPLKSSIPDINLGTKKAYTDAVAKPEPTRSQAEKDLIKNTEDKVASGNKTVSKMISNDLSGKDVAGLMSTKVDFEVPDPTPADPNNMKIEQKSILVHPAVIAEYTPSLLLRMAQEMSPEDITTVRTAIDDEMTRQLALVGNVEDNLPKKIKALNKWLKNNDEAAKFS